MRKIIIIIISIIFIILGIVFIREINNTLNNDYITSDGELTFEYNKITSINMPSSETQIVTSLDDLKLIIEEYNFNTTHSYIYIRINIDNKHSYKIKNVEKTSTQIIVSIEKNNMPENINIDVVELTQEYIIDIVGVLKDKTLPITIIYNDIETNENATKNERN